MPRLSLDSLTLTDTEPMDLIRAADSAGFDVISLWVQAPALYPRALLTDEKAAECARLLADSRLHVETLEVFDLHSFEALETYRSALERGARLGGTTALVLNYSNPDRVQVIELLARFAEIASEYELGVNLEPVNGGQTYSLVQARDLIQASGADVGITLDPHHFIRSGGSVEDIRDVPNGMIRYVQLCDGPAIPAPDIARTEAINERLYPGDGAFPLLEMLRLAPQNVTVGIECPSLSRVRAGHTAYDQAGEALGAAKYLFAALA